MLRNAGADTELRDVDAKHWLLWQKCNQKSSIYSNRFSSQVGGGQETWNLCGRLWWPSFVWLIFTGPGGGMAPLAPGPATDPQMLNRYITLSHTLPTTRIGPSHGELRKVSTDLAENHKVTLSFTKATTKRNNETISTINTKSENAPKASFAICLTSSHAHFSLKMGMESKKRHPATSTVNIMNSMVPVWEPLPWEK